MNKLLKRLPGKLKLRNKEERKKKDLFKRKTNVLGERKSDKKRKSKDKWIFKGKDRRKKNVVSNKRLGKLKSRDDRSSKTKSEWKKKSDLGLSENSKLGKMNGREVRSRGDRLRLIFKRNSKRKKLKSKIDRHFRFNSKKSNREKLRKKDR